MDQHYRRYATSTSPNMGVCQCGAMPLQVVGTSDASTSSMLWVLTMIDLEDLLRRFVVRIASDVRNMTYRYVSQGCYDIVYTGYSAQFKFTLLCQIGCLLFPVTFSVTCIIIAESCTGIV